MYIFGYCGGSSSCECQYRDFGQNITYVCYFQIGRTEIVSPLRNAVSFVHDDKGNRQSFNTSDEFPDKEFILKVYERVGNFLEIALGCGMDSIYEFNLKRFCTTFKYAATPVLNALKILTISGYIEFIEETDSLSRIMILVHKD